MIPEFTRALLSSRVRPRGGRRRVLAIVLAALQVAPAPLLPELLSRPAFAQERAPPAQNDVPAAAPEAAPATPNAEAPPDAKATPLPKPSTSEAICLLVESAAQAHGLPFEFFARLIWQESRFQPNAVGPMTRNGQRAQGIAQFMPGTANERGLFDPFDPVSALPKAAEFLEELHHSFGNLGLAAAAYNAGPRRIRDWLDGHGGLPAETRNYVIKITGRSAEDWAAASRTGGGDKAPLPKGNCRELMALLHTEPSPFVTALERRVAQGNARPWGVELSAGFSHDRVLTVYAGLLKRFGEILSGRDPSILSGVLRSRGIRAFYRVSIGAPTREAANDLCTQIHRAGGACLVIRNRGQAG